MEQSSLGSSSSSGKKSGPPILPKPLPQALVDAFKVQSTKELHEKHSSALALVFTGMAQGSEATLQDDLLVLFCKHVEVLGETTLK